MSPWTDRLDQQGHPHTSVHIDGHKVGLFPDGWWWAYHVDHRWTPPGTPRVGPEPAGPGPYQEPTAKEIRDLLPKRGPSLEVQVQLRPDLAAHLNQVLEDARSMLPAWVRPVVEELARARAKFPTAEHRTLALMEEAGEVVKAALDLHNRKPGATRAALNKEIIQTMAMCVRLLEEGDPAVLGEEVA